jgi:hypothetical protein
VTEKKREIPDSAIKLTEAEWRERLQNLATWHRKLIARKIAVIRALQAGNLPQGAQPFCAPINPRNVLAADYNDAHSQADQWAWDNAPDVDLAQWDIYVKAGQC